MSDVRMSQEDWDELVDAIEVWQDGEDKGGQVYDLDQEVKNERTAD